MRRVFLLQGAIGRDAADDIAQPAGAFEHNHPLPVPQTEEQHMKKKQDFVQGFHVPA